MSDLVLHRGSQLVEKEALDLIPIPPATDSYQPVTHFELAKTLSTIGQDVLKDYALIGEQYAIARQGNQMFACLNFKSDHSEMGLSVGFRNSYDRSMSIGIAIGAQIFICDNLALTGDIAVMKKHTKNVWNSLEDLAISTLYRAGNTFGQIVEDSETLKQRMMTDDEAYMMLGLLYGRGVLSPRQIPVVRDNWLKPKHSVFEPRNQWSFYNSNTEALKSCSPLQIMDRHKSLHAVMTGEVIDV